MDWSLLGFQGLAQVFNIHPVFVHFPIALFPTALLFYTIGILKNKDSFLFAGRASLILAFLSVLPTVVTGLMAMESFPHNETIHRMMMTHQKIGYAICAFGLILFVWSFIQNKGLPKFSKIFLFILSVTVLLVLQNGDLGGRMVFMEGAAVKTLESIPPTSLQMQTKPESGEEKNHQHGDHDHNH